MGAALVAIAAALALAYKLFTRDVLRDVEQARSAAAPDDAEVQHKVRNHSSRITAIEHLRMTDIERIVQVETSLAGVEKGLERVGKTVNERFDQLAVSV